MEHEPPTPAIERLRASMPEAQAAHWSALIDLLARRIVESWDALQRESGPVLAEGDRLLTQREVCRLLGLSKTGFRSWAGRIELPAYRLGVDKGVRYRLSEITAAVEACRQSRDSSTREST